MNLSDINETLVFFRSELNGFCADYERMRKVTFTNSLEDLERKTNYFGNLLYASNLLIMTLLSLRSQLAILSETSGNFSIIASLKGTESEIKDYLVYLKTVNYSLSQLLNSTTEVLKIRAGKYSSVLGR